MSMAPSTTDKKIPYVLMILDGFGYRVDTRDNAIAAAHTPYLDQIYQTYPHGLISGSGEDVGLPEGQFGNSEVGHMNLGAGRILYQDSTRIHQQIRNGEFFHNPVLVEAVTAANAHHGRVHVMGLLSDGGVHAHQDHIVAMCELALQQGAKQVLVHAFLDGRDTPPKSADKYLGEFATAIAALNQRYNTGNVAVVSLIGRYFAMDRDKRWERVQQAYDLLTQAKAVHSADTAEAGLATAYAAGETDEFVQATRIDVPNQSAEFGAIQDGDSVVFMNFRADRARQLTAALTDPKFNGFSRARTPTLARFVMLTRYSDDLAAQAISQVAFLPTSLDNTLGEYLQKLGKTQLRIAETEKYAHVTFFFSGGREAEYSGETRILVPSPDVATYDLKPEMSAYEVTEQLKAAIESGKYDVLVVNYANGDMVGHTGVFDAAVKAVETLDYCVHTISEAVLAADGHLLITADHGNVEQMQDYDSGQVHTQHTTELVPLIYINQHATPANTQIRANGRLSDVAPTILDLMGVPKPEEMTGESLLVRTDL